MKKLFQNNKLKNQLLFDQTYYNKESPLLSRGQVIFLCINHIVDDL